MAAYRRFVTHVTCRLTGRNRDQLRYPKLGIEYGIPFYLKFMVSLTYDSDLQRAKISLGNITSQFTNTFSDDLMISQANRI